MALIKTYPVSLGNHGNTHFIAKKKDAFIFKIVAFHELGKAYIISHSCKFPKELINTEELHNLIKEDIERKWDFTLATESKDLFLSFKNTEEVINHYKLII